MAEYKFRIRSTSRSTAEVDPIVLRLTDRVRLAFKPTLVDKLDGLPPAIKGNFIYQKKRPSGFWQDITSVNLASLKDGEGVHIELRSEEVTLLYAALRNLYSIGITHGIPRGQSEFDAVPLSTIPHQLPDGLIDEESFGELLAEGAIGSAVVTKFLEWITSRDISQLAGTLDGLDAVQLLNFDAAIGAARLKAFLQGYEENLERAEESYWHKLLKENSWVLAQVYAHPLLIIDDQVYVGGKGMDNRDGNVADFLYGNPLTEDAAIVEIKTPTADLLVDQQYRNNTWSPSAELSGAVQQVLVNKRSLIENHRALVKEDDPASVKAFNPKALLIIGNAERELGVTSKRRCFELYRRNLRDVDVVTFDELHAKAAQLVRLLESV